jgi:hypothetical protein
MNREIAFNKLGGLYVYQDTLNAIQKAYSEPPTALSYALGDKYILTGVNVVGGQVTAGSIVFNGEILPFIGGALLGNVIIETIVSQELFDDGALKDTYYVKRAKMVAVAGGGSFPFSDLKRLPLLNSSLYDSLDKYHEILKSLINFEPEVILNGCLVTNVAAGNCDISAGLMMFNGQLKAVEAYSGSFPAYATDAGTWQTALPGTGLYIKFDPHTSQRYTDVLNRAMVKPGKIEMYETLSDRFVNGVGRWEMKGFNLASSMQGRVPVGLWFDGVAINNVTDAQYANAQAQGGEKKHKLVPDEQGSLDAQAFMDDGDDTTGTRISLQQLKLNGNLITHSSGNQWGNIENIKLKNDALEHENMQPFTVIVYVKRA